MLLLLLLLILLLILLLTLLPLGAAHRRHLAKASPQELEQRRRKLFANQPGLRLEALRSFWFGDSVSSPRVVLSATGVPHAVPNAEPPSASPPVGAATQAEGRSLGGLQPAAPSLVRPTAEGMLGDGLVNEGLFKKASVTRRL